MRSSAVCAFFVAGTLLFAAPQSGCGEQEVEVTPTMAAGVGDGDNDGLDVYFRVDAKSMQLAGCNTDCGRVEFKYDDQDGETKWGTMCSDKWTLKEAAVVCRMLGFEDAFGAMPTFGGGEGRVLISSVDCTGDEERLQDCALTFGSGNCTHGSDVGVSCIASGLAGSTPAQKRAAQVTVEGWMGQRHHRRKSVTRSWGLVSASSTGPTDCEIMDGVPLPFQQDMGEQAYVYFEKLQTRWEEMDHYLRLQLCNPAGDAGITIQRTLVDLTSRGLSWSALGMDMTQIKPAASPEERDLIHELYLAHNKHGALHYELDEPLRQVDAPTVAQSGAPPIVSSSSHVQLRTQQERAMFAKLQRDGILRVDDFGFSEAALASLTERAADLLSGEVNGVTDDGARVSVTSGGSVITARSELPQLEELYQNTTMHRVIQAYLGRSVTLDGHKLTKLSTVAGSDVKSYIAARWHHDRAGRRIKLFVYLHDVDCEQGHPTQVAIGTQNLIFYRTEDFPTSRYKDSYVRNQHNVVKGCGRRGGGFLFDTHMIHMGTPEGNATRTTAIIEFHNALKCPATRAMGLPIPCPSGDQFMLQRRFGGM